MLASASVGAFPFQRLADVINHRLTYNVGQPIIPESSKYFSGSLRWAFLFPLHHSAHMRGEAMKMNDKDVGFWADVLNGLKNSWPQISGAALAATICYGRLIYDGAERKNKWIEVVLCDALSLCISSGLDVVGLPISMSPFVGGLVGFIGVEKLRGIAIRAISRRIGAGDSNTQE